MKKQFLNVVFTTILAFGILACNDKTEKTVTESTTATAPELKNAFINGDSLHYIDVGKGDPVIFVHGTLDDYRLWQMHIDTFAKNHRVIAYSRRYAYPDKQVINDSADYSVAIHAADLAAFIKSLGLGPVHLVGHSYGAYTALLTAQEHPELVRSLMLGEPPVLPLLQNVVGGDTIVNNFINMFLKPASDAFKSGNNEKAVSIFLGGVTGDSNLYANMPKEVRDQMNENILELRGVALSKNLFPPISCDDLKKIKTPTMIMTGERTLLMFKAINEQLDKCLTNKEKVILTNASHGLETENPSDFNKIVLAFINKH